MSDPDPVLVTALMMAQGLYPEDPLFTASVPARTEEDDGRPRGV